MEEKQKKQAMITALRSLTAGDKSEHDLSTKLRQKGYPDAVIQLTLNQLKAQGFLNDQVYAQKLSDYILNSKRSGTHKLAFELKKKRVPESIRKAVLEAVDPAEQKLQALEIASQKVLSFRDTDTRVLKKKLYDFLIRKGYDFQLAQETSQAVILQLKRSQNHENE